MYRGITLSLTILLVFAIMWNSATGADHLPRPVTERPFSSAHAFPAAQLPALPGIVQPKKEVEVESQTLGTLMTVSVSEGQQVKEGEILAQIDNRVALTAVEVARATASGVAAVQHAREELSFAETLLDRLRALKLVNAGSDFELLETQSRVAKAKATLAAAEEDRERAKRTLELELAKLERYNIRAPFSGQIIDVKVDAGTTLTRDDILLTLIQLDELEVELHVPLDLYNRLEVGRSYTLIAGSPVNHSISAQLTFAAPVVNAATRTFRTIFTIDNHNLQLPAGFTVRLDSHGLSSSPALAKSR